MARVEEKTGALPRAADWYVRRSYGRRMALTGVMAQSPWNMMGWGMLEFGNERSHKVEEKLKDLAATKAATVIGCQFCIDIGSALGRKAGVSEDQLRDFHNYRDSSAFSPVEKLVMEYAEEMSQTNVEISDELFARLREHFDDTQIVELTVAIATENFRARLNNALDIPPAGFSEGMYCPVPERQAVAGADGDQSERTIA
jgi:AhpD family alkylhydroperoxidase